MGLKMFHIKNKLSFWYLWSGCLLEYQTEVLLLFCLQELNSDFPGLTFLSYTENKEHDLVDIVQLNRQIKPQQEL